MEPICEYYSSPGGNDEYLYLFAGRADLSSADGIYGLENEGEDIRVHVVSIKDLWSLLDQAKLNNAHTLIAVQWHHLRLKALWG